MFDKGLRLLGIVGCCAILLFGLLGCMPTPPANFVSTGGPVGFSVYAITKGPDGNLWFTEPNIILLVTVLAQTEFAPALIVIYGSLTETKLVKYPQRAVKSRIILFPGVVPMT